MIISSSILNCYIIFEKIFSYLPFEGYEGQEHDILITEMAHDKVSLVGHTKSYHQVLVKGNPDDLMGKRVKVRVTATTKHSMIADIIGEPREVAISRNYQIEKGPDFIKFIY